MQKLNDQQVFEMGLIKSQIRCLVSNVYDLQKLRVAAGNRLVQSFYLQVNTDETSDTSEEKEAKLISTLRKEYKNIQKVAEEREFSTKKAIEYIQSNKSEESSEIQYIRNDVDFRLMESYMLLEKSEETAIKVLEKYVKQHPLWDAFFKDVKGCGVLMSAMCIAYLDAKKARHVSSFYRYCGLDTVKDTDKDGNQLFITDDGTNRIVKYKYEYTYKCDGDKYDGAVKMLSDCDEDGIPIAITTTGEYLNYRIATTEDGDFVYEDVDTKEEYRGAVIASEHGRRKGDTEMFEYTDKAGNKAMKRGITYNPVLKTKLMGVLTGCIIKAGDNEYSRIYRDYKSRLDLSPKHRDKTAGHKNMMAQRYMIKQFLRNLWVAWRQLEGLEVDLPYEVEKLGYKPHKYNQYQCDVADKRNTVTA